MIERSHGCARWHCPHCGGTGWSRDGSLPAHDRPSGKSCRPSGQISEAEIKARLGRRFDEQARLFPRMLEIGRQEYIRANLKAARKTTLGQYA